MATANVPDNATEVPVHSRAFLRRRFLNWFPMGLTYAFLYMGRYNLTVAKNALGDLMTKEDFGIIFGAGTITYGVAFLLNGPLTDKIGGKRAILISAFGSAIMNLAMGFYLSHVLAAGNAQNDQIRLAFSLLYAGNMYFQSFGAVAIVKVNAAWFHIRERGGFSGIFGTMISSGIFFAFTVNAWVLGAFQTGLEGSAKTYATRWVFYLPAAILLTMGVLETILLRDRPSEAGQRDFDTGDANIGEGEENISSLQIMKKVFTNPIVVTVGLIEFCTGVVRNGVMQWYPTYVKEVFSLPSEHYLNNGNWSDWRTVLPFFVLAALFFGASSRASGKWRAIWVTSGGLLFLAPFLQGGWGGLQMVAGVLGGNIAGYVSDLFFQSRRAPAAGGLYWVLFACTIGMMFALGLATNVLQTAPSKTPLQAGDTIVAVDGQPVSDWVAARQRFQCVPTQCLGGAKFETKNGNCICSSHAEQPAAASELRAAIPVEIVRGGETSTVQVPDPAVGKDKDGNLKPKFRAGDGRRLGGQPVLTMTPYLLGVLVFVMSLCVIGTHGLLSGTATMDFGGRKGAATAVGMIDGFVYLGTGLQSLSLGYLTSRSWSYWPMFLLPFTLIGALLCLRIWNARPAPRGPVQPATADDKSEVAPEPS
jgi:sugar phosphate permease